MIKCANNLNSCQNLENIEILF
uniref:Uncharacterized protein n=1 Tax=Anguilla anguilla TaxID=7936 RepID=A0A0E9R3A9_ANGAN